MVLVLAARPKTQKPGRRFQVSGFQREMRPWPLVHYLAQALSGKLFAEPAGPRCTGTVTDFHAFWPPVHPTPKSMRSKSNILRSGWPLLAVGAALQGTDVLRMRKASEEAIKGMARPTGGNN